MKYGFITASGGKWYTNKLKMLKSGDRIWVKVPKKGFVGIGIVKSEAALAKDMKLVDDKNIFELDNKASYSQDHIDDEFSAVMVKVEWIITVKERDAISELGFFGNQNTVCKPTDSKWNNTIDILKKRWGIKE